MTLRRLKRGRRERGAAAVELALVLPVLATLIFGQIEAARLGMVSQMLNVAAREGCRVAVINGNTNTDVQTQVNSILKNAGLDDVTMTMSPSDCTTVHTSSSPSTITLTLSTPFSPVCWPSPSQYFQGVSLTASATMSSERP